MCITQIVQVAVIMIGMLIVVIAIVILMLVTVPVLTMEVMTVVIIIAKSQNEEPEHQNVQMKPHSAQIEHQNVQSEPQKDYMELQNHKWNLSECKFRGKINGSNSRMSRLSRKMSWLSFRGSKLNVRMRR